jgi:hypothetical protein
MLSIVTALNIECRIVESSHLSSSNFWLSLVSFQPVITFLSSLRYALRIIIMLILNDLFIQFVFSEHPPRDIVEKAHERIQLTELFAAGAVLSKPSMMISILSTFSTFQGPDCGSTMSI